MNKKPEAALHHEITCRLAGLVTAPVRCIPDLPCAAPKAKGIWSGQWTRAEMVGARHYEELGYEVVRLEHAPSGSVGQDYETWIPGGKQLGDAMRRILPKDAYAAWTFRKPHKELVLNGVYPCDYPLSGYVPDLLLSRNGEWRLVEVKGPGDALHPRQANWLVSLRPKDWPYEVCMPIRRLAEPVLFDAPVGKGANFDAIIAEWAQEVDDYRVGERIRPLTAAYIQAREAFENLLAGETGSAREAALRTKADACLAALIEAEDRFAIPYARLWRKIYIGTKKKVFDRKDEWKLPSGRPISAIDPQWPPKR